MNELLRKHYYIPRFKWDIGWFRMASRASRTPFYPFHLLLSLSLSGYFHTKCQWYQGVVFSGTFIVLDWPHRIIILLFEIELCKVLNFITEFNTNNYLKFNEFHYWLNCFWVVPLNLLKRSKDIFISWAAEVLPSHLPTFSFQLINYSMMVCNYTLRKLLDSSACLSQGACEYTNITHL